jgi:biotin synthase-like enzyme
LQDRLDTLANVQAAGISMCAGGIIGLGEGPKDRIGLIHQLATLAVHPESVPMNSLVAIAGTPMEVLPLEELWSFASLVAAVLHILEFSRKGEITVI